MPKDYEDDPTRHAQHRWEKPFSKRVREQVRHAKAGSEVSKPRKKKKDTKKWCLGKEGRPHVDVLVDYWGLKNYTQRNDRMGEYWRNHPWHVFRCERCERIRHLTDAEKKFLGIPTRMPWGRT